MAICTLFYATGCSQAGASEETLRAETEPGWKSDSIINADDAIGCDTITFAFTGDIMMGTTWPDSINGTHLPQNSGRNLFDDCRDILQRADIACGNLEGCLLDGPGQRRQMRNPDTYYVFRMPTSYAANLVDAGFDFVGIANNHINDFGQTGRNSTIRTLQDVGILHAGLRGRCETTFIERKGMRIVLTQFGHGGNNLSILDLTELRRVVEAMRDTADIVVVSFHGGAEGKNCTHVPHAEETFVGERRGNVEQFAHAAIDAGADIVFGHGPHVPRAAELYKDRIILYSLGNFCTPYRVSITGVSGYAPIAEITVDNNGRFLGGKIHSFIQRRGIGPRMDSSDAAARLIRSLSIEDFPSSPLQISDDGLLTPQNGVDTAPHEARSRLR